MNGAEARRYHWLAINNKGICAKKLATFKMADQRPPRHSGFPSQTPTAAPRRSPSNNDDHNASAPDQHQPPLSTQSSFQSLEPYDERNLRDCEHTPKRRDWNVAGNDTSRATSAAERTATANDALHMPNISSKNRNQSDRRQNLITRRSAPEFGGHGGSDYYDSPVMKSGHRRRRPTGSGSSNKAKEHQSPKPHYANRYAVDGSTPNADASISAKRRLLGRQSSTTRNVMAAQNSVPLDTTANSNASSLLPVLRALCHALFVACSTKCKAICRNSKFVISKTVGRKWVRYFLYVFCIVITFLLICLSMAVYGFYQEATKLCTPPPAYHAPIDEPPLIEYFVHGRGNGHYARSVAIIEKLNDAGIDVRMFIGRATMWRAVHESHISSSEAHRKHSSDKNNEDGTTWSKKRRGVTTAIAVTSITPAMGIFDTLSHILERIIGDCEVAHQTGRYPALVVTDGDVPGMFRAWFGSVPSVGISHGQTFAIGRKPEFIKTDARLNTAWNKQQTLNWRAAFLTNWQIGTSFAAMDTRHPSGVIAMSPMRPEAIGMAKERWRRSHASEAGGLTRPSNSTHSDAATLAKTYLTQEQREKIDRLLLDRNSNSPSERPRRKLVICYFRDKNGDVMQNALLRSGFDILLFERGYHKGLMNIQGVEKFGHQWIVHREHEEEEELTDLAIEDYWKTMLEGTNAKLLEDGSSKSTNATVEDEENTIAKANEEGDFDTSENSNNKEPRIIRVTDMSLFIPLLSIADGVASSAGSQLISECIYSGTPILSLYRANDDEQMLNVMIYRNLIANDKEKNTSGIGKVVHGIAHEEFSDAFSFLAVDNLQEVNPEKDANTPNGIASKLLTKEQEFLLLRDAEAKRAYKEFDDFVDAISRSKVSSSYYEEATMVGKIQVEEENPDLHNPFQGMPDVAPVMLEILKEVIGEQT